MPQQPRHVKSAYGAAHGPHTTYQIYQQQVLLQLLLLRLLLHLLLLLLLSSPRCRNSSCGLRSNLQPGLGNGKGSREDKLSCLYSRESRAEVAAAVAAVCLLNQLYGGTEERCQPQHIPYRHNVVTLKGPGVVFLA